VLPADPVVPPDPLEVGDLDQDQRDDAEEQEVATHPSNRLRRFRVAQ